MEGTVFGSVDTVKVHATELVNKLSKDDLSIASSSGRIVEETTLRVILFPQCNLLSKKILTSVRFTIATPRSTNL